MVDKSREAHLRQDKLTEALGATLSGWISSSEQGKAVQGYAGSDMI